MKTSELTGLALDWAVAKIEGLVAQHGMTELEIFYGARAGGCHRYSTDWAQGGPLIERENVCLRGISPGFHAWYHQCPPKSEGPTMLIAAIRCYITRKLGDEVDVPKELCRA